MHTDTKGFLLVEVTLTIALVALIGAFALPASMAFFTERKFEEQSDAVVHAIRTARDQSIAGKDGATYGVAFFTDRYVLFEGTTYTARVAAKDVTHPLPSGIAVDADVASLNEIAFANTGGITTNTSATVEITKNSLLRKLIFNKYGAETVWPVVDTANLPEEAVGALEAYWKFDETGGTRYDSAGMYDLVKRDTDLASGTGKINKGGQLGNYGQVRNIDGALGNANRDFTVAGWVNLLSGGTDAYLVSGIVDQTDAITWSLRYDAARNRFAFGSGGTDVFADAIGAPATGTWYFVAASYNAATKGLSLRINNGSADTATLYGMAQNGTGVLIGGVGSARIDEIGIWEKVLTDAELATLYNNGAGTTSPFSGTLGVKTGAFAAGTPTDLPAVDCGYLHIQKTLLPLSIETGTTTGLAAWSSSTAALSIDGAGALTVNNGSTSTLTQTVRFRNFKDASSTPPDYLMTATYGTDRIAVDIYGLGGINVQDAVARIVRPATSTISLAKGTSMARPKVARYEGKTTDDWFGWQFAFNNNDADALARNDDSFGFDFSAKLNGPSSTLAIDGAKMTACIPIYYKYPAGGASLYDMVIDYLKGLF